MSDRSLTLLELHLDGANVQIGPKRIVRSKTSDAKEYPEDPDEETPASRGATPVGALVSVVVVLLAIVAIVGRARQSAARDSGLELEDEAEEN
jgi:hypothetical protein